MIPIEMAKNRTIGDIVADDYRTAEVFKKFDIDFCCGGKRTLAEVCQQKNIDLEALEKALTNLDLLPHPGRRLPFNDWDLPFLTDYIVNIHHRYVGAKIPQLLQYARKVAKVHGDAFPETRTIADELDKLSEELLAHMKKEENVLFPYVKQLWHLQHGNGPAVKPPFGSARHPISAMESEHDFAGDSMRNIRRLSNDFTPPESACNTYRVLYALLKEFEEDLHQHVHLENNILFPKVIALEKKVFELAG